MTAADTPRISVYLPSTLDVVEHYPGTGPPLLLPTTFAVEWRALGGSVATLSVAVTEDEAKVVGLEVEARKDPETGVATLHPAIAAVVGDLGDPARALELAMEQGRTIFGDRVGISDDLDVAMGARAWASAASVRQRRLELVAGDYLSAGGGRGAIKVLMEQHNVSRSTASRLVRQAREQGLLPPLTKKERDE